MIIEKFQEQVQAVPEKIAVKAGNREITYSELDHYANRVANVILAKDRDRDAAGSAAHRQVSLLFEHGTDMIISVLGALKAAKTYVPLDVAYPEKRLLYMLEDSGSYLILTNESNLPAAVQLAGQARTKIDILNIDAILNQTAGCEIDMNTKAKLAAPRQVNPDSPAYILYTSGSTGQPKGVVQTQRNVLYYTRHWIKRFSITRDDRLTFITSFSHDQSVQDIFAALLAGAALYPYYIKATDSTDGLYTLLMKEKITIWHSVPTFFRYFVNNLTEKNVFYDIRWLLLGGEPLRPHDLEFYRVHFPNSTLGVIYGQTESSVSSICNISQTDLFDDVSLGEPLDETKILLVGEDGDVIETMGVGEIVVASDYLAAGYWRDKEKTDRVFTHDDELGRLYWTGDLCRLTMDGLIKVMGRKDTQIKIRGFRVEAGEIESLLLKHEAVKEAVVMAKEDQNLDNYLCVYFVSHRTITPEEFREYLFRQLPEYMIPRYFISLEQMPLTPNGKIDRRRLPEPEELIKPGSEYAPPTNEIEKKLVEIWQEVLAKEKVGINDNFIEMGGHSLLVISILSKIHREFHVELQLRDVFENPTVKEVAQLIISSERSIFSSVPCTEKKEYYIAAPDQKRIYVLSQFDGIGTTYNLYGVTQLQGSFDRQKFETIFQRLVQRHEAIRTSFQLVRGQVVQIIRDDIPAIQIPYIDAETGKTKSKIREIVNQFIRPFDIGNAPLLRAGLIKLGKEKHLLLLDFHHIISDAVSALTLSGEFFRLYAGEELPSQRLRYRDYSEWLNRLAVSGKLKHQENYWHNRYKGEIPELNLPLDFPRGEQQSFEGGLIGFRLTRDVTRQLNSLAKETGATLYLVLLAMYNVLLHKYTGQEDIIVGSIISGRPHVDLEQIVGFFAKTLPLRSHPRPHQTFELYLEDLKKHTFEAFDNQLYPFDQLVEQLQPAKSFNRNPLFDAAFLFINREAAVPSAKEKSTGSSNKALMLTSYQHEYTHEITTTMFDLFFQAFAIENELLCVIQYNTALFEPGTIKLMKERFLILMRSILNNPRAKIQDLEFAVPIEKEMRTIDEIEIDL